MNQRFKKYLIPSVYTLSLIAFAISIYFIQKIMNNQKPKDPNTKYVANEILEHENIVPVINDHQTKIIRPYLETDITIGQSYYDYQGEKKAQEEALIYYENTYIQNSGVDYTKEEQFDVVSILDGTVINIKNDDILGTTIEIRHNNELISVYQSVENIQVKENDTVLQGQIIGTSGKNNINAKLNNHLHFELFYRGNIVNPEAYYDKEINELS